MWTASLSKVSFSRRHFPYFCNFIPFNNPAKILIPWPLWVIVVVWRVYWVQGNFWYVRKHITQLHNYSNMCFLGKIWMFQHVMCLKVCVLAVKFSDTLMKITWSGVHTITLILNQDQENDQTKTKTNANTRPRPRSGPDQDQDWNQTKTIYKIYSTLPDCYTINFHLNKK